MGDDDVPTTTTSTTRQPRRRRTPTPGRQTLTLWQALWSARHGEPLPFPGRRAWVQLQATCKRLAEAVPDPEVREEVLRAWLRVDGRVADYGHPLEWALRAHELRRLTRLADRVVADRRRAGALPVLLPPRDPCAPAGCRYVVTLRAFDGRVVATGQLSARDDAAATQLAEVRRRRAGADVAEVARDVA